MNPEEFAGPEEFLAALAEGAGSTDRLITLADGADERVLTAAGQLRRAGVVRLELLGDPAAVAAAAGRAGVELRGIRVTDPARSRLRDDLADHLLRRRADRGMTPERAHELVADPLHFGACAVATGHADGMVAGASRTTADTLRAALMSIDLAPGSSLVSSYFLMITGPRLLLFADCAVNPTPGPDHLANIAVDSARSATTLGLEPRVAMLSYATGTSADGERVAATREAVRLARERDPGLLVDGPLQFDAAVDPGVARTKAPDSPVAGRANVLVFPSLEAGNIGYKAVQHLSGSTAVGPVLQGLSRPVNDLSRGARVADIRHTIELTALQCSATPRPGAAPPR